jgi:hypothetical protein
LLTCNLQGKWAGALLAYLLPEDIQEETSLACIPKSKQTKALLVKAILPREFVSVDVHSLELDMSLPSSERHEPSALDCERHQQ